MKKALTFLGGVGFGMYVLMNWGILLNAAKLKEENEKLKEEKATETEE